MRDKRLTGQYFDCGHWDCKKCFIRCIKETSTKLYAVTEHLEHVHSIFVRSEQKVAVKKALNRAGHDHFTVTLRHDLGALIVSSGEVSGRGWATEPHGRGWVERFDPKSNGWFDRHNTDWIRSGFCDQLWELSPDVKRCDPSEGWKAAKSPLDVQFRTSVVLTIAPWPGESPRYE